MVKVFIELLETLRDFPYFINFFRKMLCVFDLRKKYFLCWLPDGEDLLFQR